MIDPGERIVAGQRFSDNQLQQLRQLSLQEHKPIGTLVREAVTLYLRERLQT